MAQIQPLLNPYSPRINWNEPLAKGLVFDHNAIQGGGLITNDIALNSPGSILTATWANSLYGMALDYSTAGSKTLYSTLPAATNTLEKFSVEFLALYRSTGGGGLGRIAQKTNTATNGRWFVFTGSSASNQMAFQVTTSGTDGLHRYNNFFPTNEWVHGVLTFDGSTITNSPVTYRNGVFVAIDSAVAPTGTWDADDSYLCIGNRNNTTTRTWDGKIAYFRMWNRILLSTEAKELYTNPWQIYVGQSQLNKRVNSVAAPAGSTFSGYYGQLGWF